MDAIIALLLEFWPIIAGALGAAGVFLAGRKSGQARSRIKDLERERDMAIARERARREAERWDDDAVVDLLTGERRKP